MKTRNIFLLPMLLTGLGLMPAGRVTADTFTILHSFTASDGGGPRTGLILSGDTLYGTAQYGGASAGGAVFKVNTDGTDFTTLHNFTRVYPNEYPTGTNGDGANPVGGVILLANTLYGTAEFGGPSGIGTVFSVNTDGTGFSILYGFTARSVRSLSDIYTNSSGGFPVTSLASSGDILYGTGGSGGSAGSGTVFALNTDGTGLRTLHSFTARPTSYPYSNSDGTGPDGSLILSGDKLYGTAAYAGSWDNGTVFSLSTDGTGFTVLHHFTANELSNSDGAHPLAGLILSGDTLYGTALLGGESGQGTVFKVNMDGNDFATLHSFEAMPWPCFLNSEGSLPYGGLVLLGHTLYGTAHGGGSSGYGTVFAVNTDGTGFTNLHNFTGASGDGASPAGSLVLSGKTLYGTTEGGGESGVGTVFKLLVNHAPSAVANVAPLFALSSAQTNRFIIAPDGSAATVILDGTQSSDPDNDPLHFSWSADGQPTAVSIGALATNLFAVGPHIARLVLSDGYDTTTAQVGFEVITPATAVGKLILVVEEASLGRRNQQRLLTPLSATMKSFDRGRVRVALYHLSVFQHKVRAQLAPWNPALADELTAASQQIINIASGR
jgi:uncharacterized repeat protein (TIGR03803 family)